MTDNRNPLPQADRSSQLQRKSIIEFQKVLPENLFVFRHEPIDDAGVDGSLEILIDGYYTNMRTQVQLKSKVKKEARRDGVVTLSIEPSNLNYLLNGSLGLYVLYVDESKELFYAWASEENRRRFEINSDWKNKTDITIPLKELNDGVLKDIYDRIHQDAVLRRKIIDSLAHAPSNDNISISINSETLESVTSSEVEDIIRNSGMTLVAAGYSKFILDKLKLISPRAAAEARFILINGYANYFTGRYQTALGLVAEAIISERLQDEDRRFAERIHLACQLNLGIITNEEYFHQSETQITNDELLSEIKLNKLIAQFRSQVEPTVILLNEITELKNKIIASDKAPDSLKLNARVKYMEIIGFDAVRAFSDEICKAGARKNNPLIFSPFDQIIEYRKVFANLECWSIETNKLIQDAIEISQPIFVAEALYVKAYISIMRIISTLCFMEFEEIPTDRASLEGEILSTLKLCEKAQKIYKQADMIEGEVRTHLIMAQAFEIMNQPESAKKMAQGIIGKAKLLGYHHQIATAKEIIEDNSLFSKMMDNIRNILGRKHNEEYDKSDLATEEEIENFTNFLIDTYKIPDNRREIVRRDVICIRDTNREKVEWCRHIEIDQNLKHTQSSLTLYAEDPNRRVKCLKFEHIVDHLSPNWIEQISEFKIIYCAECPDREPSNTTSP
jgi:hypothetical protein